MGKRLLCQEEKLKFLSSGKEGVECLARISVPSINISPTIAAPDIRINPDKSPWSSLPFSIGFMNWKPVICDHIQVLNSFSRICWKQKHLGPVVSQEHCGVVCYPHRTRKAISYRALAADVLGALWHPCNTLRASQPSLFHVYSLYSFTIFLHVLSTSWTINFVNLSYTSVFISSRD